MGVSVEGGAKAKGQSNCSVDELRRHGGGGVGFDHMLKHQGKGVGLNEIGIQLICTDAIAEVINVMEVLSAFLKS